MKSVGVLVIFATTAVVLLAASVSSAQSQSQRDQIAAAQQQHQQQQQQQAGDMSKSGGGRVTRRDYPYDNSWWAIGLILVPLLLLLCFPLFSTPYGYGGGYGGHHHGGHGHHGGYGGWGRSNTKEAEAIQERVLKSVEEIMTSVFAG